MVNTSDLYDVFVLNPAAWSPRKAVYRVAVAWAQQHNRPIPSSRTVFTALRSRGFAETTRRGTAGFVGIYTPPELAALPPLTRVPGTATAYKQGDLSPESRDALLTERALARAAARGDLPADAEPHDPFRRLAAPDGLGDGYSRATRATEVLIVRAESVHGPRHTWTCYREGCARPATTVDHVVPWSESHDSTPANLRPSCPHHNFSRGARADDAA